MTPQEKLSQLCKDILADDENKRTKILEILKKYEPKGNPTKMTEQQAKEACKEVEKLKEEK